VFTRALVIPLLFSPFGLANAARPTPPQLSTTLFPRSTPPTIITTPSPFQRPVPTDPPTSGCFFPAGSLLFPEPPRFPNTLLKPLYSHFPPPQFPDSKRFFFPLIFFRLHAPLRQFVPPLFLFFFLSGLGPPPPPPPLLFALLWPLFLFSLVATPVLI